MKSSGYLFSKHSGSFIGIQNNQLSTINTPVLFTIKTNKRDPRKMSIYTRPNKQCIPMSNFTGGINKYEVEMNKSGEIRIKRHNNCESV